MFGLNSVRNKFLALAMAVAGIFSTGTACAQSLIQPPAVATVDANGVDLTSGKFTLPGLNVSIGTADSGLARIAGLNGSDNNTGILKITGVPVGTSGSSAYLQASLGGSTSRFFIWYSGPGVATDVTNHSPYYSGGARLDCDNVGSPLPISSGFCRMAAADGTIATYDRAYQSGGQWGAMTSVTKPDGEVLSYTYYLVGSEVKAIKSVSSSLGWMLKYEVDANYNVIKVTAINSSVTYCDPQATSCSVSTTYPYGTLTTSGSTTTIARNGTNLLSYAISGNVVTLTSAGGVTKTITYSGTDTTGRVASVSVGGSTWNYAYTLDSGGNVSQTVVTAPNGTTTKTGVSGFGVTSTTDEAGRVTTYSYVTNSNSTSFGKIYMTIAPDGSAATGGFTTYTYDGRGNVLTTTVVPKGGATNGVVNAAAALVTQAHFPACDYSATGNYKYCNKPDYVIDADGVRTDYTYDTTHGGLLKVTKPAVNSVAPEIRYSYSQITPHTYTAPGVMSAQGPVWRLTSTSTCMTGQAPACVGTAAEQKSAISFGADNANPTYNNVLPASQTQSLGNGTLSQTTTPTYDVNGKVTSVDGPKPGAVDTVYKFYDGLGRVTGAIGIDPDAGGPRNRPATRNIYDADSHVIEVDTGTVTGTDATALANMAVQERDTNTFNSAGLATVAKHYIGSAATPKDVTQRSYDNMLRLSCEAVRLNPADYNALPASACSLGTTNADGSHDRITQYNYDSVTGLLVRTVSGYGTSLARTNVLKAYDTGNATSTGTLTYVEDANGNRTSYFYDGFNRLIKTCYPLPGTIQSSSTTDCEQKAYRTTTVTGASQATSLVNSVTLRDNTSISFGYDAIGRTASKSGAVSESFTYDNFSQVITHTNNTTGGSAVTETYGYNALGWLTSDAQPMGTVNYGYDAYGKRNQMTYPGGGLYVTYTYNDGDELTGIFENGTVQIAGFAYDDYGRRTTLSRGNGVPTSYGYDSSLRLGSITQGASGASFFNQVSYGYTPADQIASKTGTNPNYNFTPGANKTLSYTIDGLNRVGAIGGTNMAYDARGNMTGDGGGTYVYNANNLLTSATQSGITSTLTYDAENRLLSIAKNGTTTQFLYDGADMIAEYNGSGGLIRRYVHGPGDDEPLVWYDGSGTGTKYYYGADDQGSVTVLTNSSGGQYAINTYDEYGVPGAGNTGRFQYTGQIWLPEIGMYYYKARMYNPAIGRFMQTDPIGYGDGMNWYAYVHGDPINGTDSSGLDGDSSNGIPDPNCKDTQATGAVCTVVVTACGGSKVMQDGQCMSPDKARCGSSVLNRMGCMADGIAEWVVPGYDLMKCGVGMFASSLHCSGSQWRNAAISGAVDVGLMFVGGPAAKTIGKIGEKVGLKALEFIAERTVKGRCFAAGTQVATPSGLKNIEDIKIGDLVLSYDDDGGRIVSKPVTQLIRNAPQATYEVKVKSADGVIDTVRATAEHPWLMASHQWAGTSSLHAADQVESATGAALTVISVRATGKVEPIYNFTVADTHTYLVGKSHAVVHNDCLKLIRAGVSDGQLKDLMAGKFHDVIAGGPGKKPITDINRLVAQYGGDADDYRKVVSETFEDITGHKFSTHAYYNVQTGELIEAKTVLGR